MRGRGRGGRGFSGGRGSSFTAFMRENKEVNEDAEVIESEDVLTLYPPMTVALPTLPNEKESFCLQAGDIFSQRYKNSLYFLKRRPEERDDIERFSDKYRKLKDDKDLYKLMELRDPSIVPPELSVDARKYMHAHTSSGTVGMKSVLADKVSGISDDNVRSDDALKSIFQRLESSEKSQAVAGGLLTSTGGRVSSTGAGADNLSDAEWAEGEFDDDGDYGKDYYASDGEDGDDGGDNDATYD